MKKKIALRRRDARRRQLRLVLGIVAAMLLAGRGSGRPDLEAQDLGCNAAANPVACENALAGDTDWDIQDAGDTSIQGFGTDISVNRGDTIGFKIDTAASAYRIDIYRLGYYLNGEGARKVHTIPQSQTLPQVQPACATDPATGLVDCGTWGVSASWIVPADAVSGIYIARPVRLDTEGASHIVFIVRDDARPADLLFQTSDTTWQAYNRYGGNSLYCGGPFSNAGTAYACPARAVKVSYNRPFDTRAHNATSWLFNAEFPMLRFLEANGFNVKYWSGMDSDRFGAQLTGAAKPKVFLSVGHDEYWSAAQRTNVEAARNAGVNLAFFSGNEMYWKTRWEHNIVPDPQDPEQTVPGSTPYRTLVSYKETLNDAKIDPAVDGNGNPIWTGTWRDPRFSSSANPHDGGRPENGLIGQIWTVNCCASAIRVPEAHGKLRFWRNTSVATQSSGATATLSPETLGYEWDEDLDNGFRPAGIIHLSDTTMNVPEKLQDFGKLVGPGSATHNLTLYRHNTLDALGNIVHSALVFGAGTVQWSWGLDDMHDRTIVPVSLPMKQATVNLLADMGAQPATLHVLDGLVSAAASTDTIAPTALITSPASAALLQSGERITITGTASDNNRVAAVEVSVDGGATWQPALGGATWSVDWSPGAVGSTTILARAIDDSLNIQTPPTGLTVTVETGRCPCTSLWNPAATTPPLIDVDTGDTSPVELGVKFKSDVAGYITGLRFYKSAANTGVHKGNLWTNSGTLLATGTYTNETTSGWQELTFSAPVPISANTTYIASYHTTTGHYSATPSYFQSAGVDSPPLHAYRATVVGGNGVYRYGATSAFPSNTFNAFNYWVDVILNTNLEADQDDPVISNLSATPGLGGTATISWTTNEPSNSRVEFGTAPETLTGSAQDDAMLTSHSVVLTGLAANATYHYRVKSTDFSSNQSTFPLLTDPPASFVMPDAVFTDTFTSHFSAGTLTGTAVAKAGDGEVILGIGAAEEFTSPTLPSAWSTFLWDPGGSATISNGVLTVDGARVDTNMPSSAGRSLEFVATMAGDASQHIGFGTTFLEAPWAIFSTPWFDPGKLYARTSSSTAFLDTLIPGSWFDAPHRFRIEWNAGKVVYYIDGQHVATHAIAITANMQPIAASDLALGGHNIVVDSFAVSPPFANAGSFQSRIFDANGQTTWGNVSWASTVPSGTSLALSVRIGNTPTPDATWSAFAPVVQGGAIGGVARYLQYQAHFTTTNAAKTPSLDAVTISYFDIPPGADTTPPVITDVAAVANASTATVTWTTNELADSKVEYGTSAGALSSSSSNATLATAHALTLTGLSANTTYYYRVISKDAALPGNTSTAPAGDPASFTTPALNPSPFVDTTVAHFAAGTLGASTSTTENDNGEVIATPALTTDFSGTALPTGWLNFAGGSSVTVGGGSVTVDGGRATTVATYGPGRSIEFVATFGAETFQHAGFAADFDFSAFAIFSTKDSSTNVFSRTSDGTFNDLGALVGVPHRYRIDWNASNVVFWVDGVQVATHGFAYGGTLRPIISDAFVGGPNVSVDWLRLGGYPTSATFLSRVFDAGGTADWGNLAWTSEAPAGTSLALSVRTGDSPTPGATWTAFSAIGTSGDPIPGTSRYAQYQAVFTSTGLTTATLKDVTIDFAAGTSDNTATTANADSYSVNEDSTLTVAAPGLLGNDTDPDNDQLTAILASRPEHGLVVLASDGSFNYAPSHNFSGTDSFTYFVNDGTVDSNVATVTITINAVNDPPIAANEAYSTPEDTPLTIGGLGVLANDEDVDSASLTAVQETTPTNPTHGIVTLNPDGTFTYTPNLNFTGTDSFSYRAKDDLNALSNIAIVTITITPVNDAPIADAQSVSTPEDTQKPIVLTGSDVDGDSFSFQVATAPAHGALSGTAPHLTYTPAANYHGTDSFTFTTRDGSITSVEATVTITVTPVNDLPVANGQSVSTPEDTATPITLTGSDVDLDALTFSVVAGPSHGVLSGTAPALIYTPASDYNGPDSFTFKANDNTADSNVATVTITVTAVNDNPVAVNDLATVAEDSGANPLAVLANDTIGPDSGETLTVTAVTQGASGAVAIAGGGTGVTYAPNANFFGTDSFTYTIGDGNGGSATASVNVTVTNVNDNPTAVNDSAAVAEDSIDNTITVLANDTIVPDAGETLTVTAVTQGANGTAAVAGGGTAASYTPNPQFFGADSFTYTISDGNGGTAVATVSVTVTNVNDDPAAVDDAAVIAEDSGANAIPVLANDHDGVDAGETLSITAVTQGANGTVAITGDGTGLTYAPNANFFGSDSFTYTIGDGNGGTATATVNVTINNLNDNPVAIDDTATVAEDSAANAIDVLTNDHDGVDVGETLTITGKTDGANGAVVITGGGTGLTYTPNADFFGSDSFTYTIGDGNGGTATATVNVTVTNLNDNPTATNDAATVAEDSTANAIDVLANDNDGVDAGETLTITDKTNGANGTVVTTGGGTGLTYTPNANFFGSDSFTYTIGDGNGGTATATVNVTVNNVNDNPTAANDAATVTEDSGANAISVLANDSIAPDSGETLTITGTTNGTSGTVVITGGGTGLTYAPNANFNGSDSFTYTVGDGNGGSATATVNVTVTAVNDGPTIADIANQTTTESNPAGPVSFTVNDIDSPLASLTLSGQSSNTTLVPVSNIAFGGVDGNRTVTVTPAAGQTGTATITVTVSDGSLSSFDTFVLTVNPRTPTTTSTPTTSLNPSTYGQAVTFTSTVSGAGGTPTGTVTFFDNGSPLGTVNLVGGLATFTASTSTTLVQAGTPVGTPRSITAVYNGSAQFAGSTSAARSQTVNQDAATAALTVSATTQQYSDMETFEVTVSGAAGAAPAQGVNFKVGTQQMNVDPVAFVNMGGGTFKATLTVPLLETTPAGQLRPTGTNKVVSATYAALSSNYSLSNPTNKTVMITKEDARVTYTGPTTVQTIGGGSAATIPLTANVLDIAQTAEANGDTTVGNIALAQVMFVNRTTGLTIATVNVGADGIASYNWNVDIGANPSQVFNVGFVVSNYYNRNNAADNRSVTVVK